MEDFAIKVENVSKEFRLPHERNSSIKSAVVNFYKQKKGYEIQKALKDVSFEVKKGEFFGIVGRNGSGKSTLLKLLAGIYVPTKGQVHVRGSLTPFIELGVGFNAELTGRENIFLNGALLGFSRKDMHKMYKDIVDFAELERFMDQKLKNYSSGMQVRLAFSIAIRAQSDILLLDEVLAVGDAAFQQKCFNYFEDLKQLGKTVVFVSHDMVAIKRFCTKAIYIKDGSLIHSGSPSEISDIYTEENIDRSTDGNSEGALSKANQIAIKIKEQSQDNVKIEIGYKSKNKDPMYIGISILKDGISVAEISTLGKHKIVGNGRIFYNLNTDMLNGGIYQIGGGLFRLNNKELVAATSKRQEFAVKGSDPSKGAALRLPEAWEA